MTLITIDKNLIDRMARDATYTAAFPFLRSRAMERDANKKCKPCERMGKMRAKLGGTEYYMRVLRDFSQLNPSRLAKLKAALRVDQVQLWYPDDQKRLIRKVM